MGDRFVTPGPPPPPPPPTTTAQPTTTTSSIDPTTGMPSTSSRMMSSSSTFEPTTMLDPINVTKLCIDAFANEISNNTEFRARYEELVDAIGSNATGFFNSTMQNATDAAGSVAEVISFCCERVSDLAVCVTSNDDNDNNLITKFGVPIIVVSALIGAALLTRAYLRRRGSESLAGTFPPPPGRGPNVHSANSDTVVQMDGLDHLSPTRPARTRPEGRRPGMRGETTSMADDHLGNFNLPGVPGTAQFQLNKNNEDLNLDLLATFRILNETQPLNSLSEYIDRLSLARNEGIDLNKIPFPLDEVIQELSYNGIETHPINPFLKSFKERNVSYEPLTKEEEEALGLEQFYDAQTTLPPKATNENEVFHDARGDEDPGYFTYGSDEETEPEKDPHSACKYPQAERLVTELESVAVVQP